ncbi:MAG: glycosyltransferase family 9 protein [Bdellovibrionales bacterium]
MFIHLGALGAVVRSTALLRLIQQKYVNSEITWVTSNPAKSLLSHHPRLKRVLATNTNDLLQLEALEFDHAFVIDKSLEATGVLKRAKVLGEVLGFVSNSDGVIIPANSEAHELWELGLNNQKKFFENKKSELQLMQESLKLPQLTSDYELPLSDSEIRHSKERKLNWQSSSRSYVVGINTGCASTLPNKKLSVQNHRDLIQILLKSIDNIQIVLLGGPEDTERNRLIAENRDVICSPTELGLRDGLCSIAACDIIVSGDSLGMHMAISQKVPVVAWFGPTCSQEIELFGRGEKLLTSATCSPCWKRSCNEKVMCYDQMDLNLIKEAVHRQLQQKQNRNQLSCSDSLSW